MVFHRNLDLECIQEEFYENDVNFGELLLDLKKWKISKRFRKLTNYHK